MLTTESAMHVSKQRIAGDFGQASYSYDGSARLQRHMGEVLMTQLQAPVSAQWAGLDLGCGTGYFSERLAVTWPEARILGADLSAAMIDHARAHRQGSLRWLQADAERLPFANGSFDRVFSNLMLQWSADPVATLQEASRVLKPEGQLVCSTLVAGTLQELAAAWAEADPGRPHVNHFEDYEALQGRISQVWPQAVVSREVITLDYSDPLHLMRELKSLGATYKASDRRGTLTSPGRLKQMVAAYPGSGESGIQATYHAAYISLWAV
ncbi:MAG: malonyl-ACP O-methyltransferase BioC [Marinobacter sp.]|nr:malonyl-ACP O-methyltransferase BioC [Marinobacter sp.]